MPFNAETVFQIHEELSKKNKIEPGFRDRNIVGSILEKAEDNFFGYENYADVYLKAAVVFEGITRLHPFVDGNKRTALASTQEYLMDNGLLFVIPISAVRFTVKVATNNNLDQDKVESLIWNISKWIRYRTTDLTSFRKTMKLITSDLKVLRLLRKISKKRGDSDLENRVIDYWLGKDIYPDLELSYEEVIAFQEQRYRRMAKYLRQGRKR